AEVVHRQDVEPTEREDEQHLDRPSAHPVNPCQLLDERVVLQAAARASRRHEALDRVARDVLDGADLGAREPGAAKPRGARGQHQLRRREATVRKESDEAAEDRLSRASVELLMRDGAREGLVRRAAGRREPAGAVTADERAHRVITREVSAGVGVRRRHGADYSSNVEIGRAPPRSAWPAIAASSILVAGMSSLLARASARGDISIVGPVFALSPIFTVIPDAVLSGTLPSPLGWFGIALAVAGTLSLSGRPDRG